MLGTQDLLVILAIAVVLFGRKRLPDLVKGMREGVKNLKESLSKPDEINVTPKKPEDAKERPEGKKGKPSVPEKRK